MQSNKKLFKLITFFPVDLQEAIDGMKNKSILVLFYAYFSLRRINYKY